MRVAVLSCLLFTPCIIKSLNILILILSLTPGVTLTIKLLSLSLVTKSELSAPWGRFKSKTTRLCLG